MKKKMFSLFMLLTMFLTICGFTNVQAATYNASGYSAIASQYADRQDVTYNRLDPLTCENWIRSFDKGVIYNNTTQVNEYVLLDSRHNGSRIEIMDTAGYRGTMYKGVNWQNTYSKVTYDIQASLRDMGATAVAIDGYFGPTTKAYVMKFQKAWGLDADGVVGSDTFQKLARSGKIAWANY